MDLILALYAFGGMLLAGLSLPLILHKIPPNRWYGFHRPPDIGDPAVWYRVNAAAGRRFLAAGLGTSFGAIVLYYLTQPDIHRYALSCLGLFLALFLWAFITSFLYLRSIQ
jgi:hypothetical protein